MEDILDEKLEGQLDEQEILKPIPLVIYFFMLAIFIYFLSILFTIQSWPNTSLIRAIGTFSILITGALSFKVFKAKNDNYLIFYWCLLLFGGLSKIAMLFIPYQNPMLVVLAIGSRVFVLGTLLTLMRYFVLRRPKKTSLNIIRYPLFFVTPILIVGSFFKMQAWPYASEMLTISVFLFFIGTMVMLIRQLKKEILALRIVTVWLVLMANLFAFAVLFKIQSWPYASEMLNFSFVGIFLGFMFKFIQQQKLQKKQTEERIE
ncbi:MAG: hypothetical protein JKY03_14190 [Aureispira sp.]|nr:hypothetical protein [Aureispira sp.]